ncbi:MAG: hypothetical protein Ct9H90mP11_06430 [Acidimicrobiales bacterium]|nr:MAG: hypothetical protein Ct9H90mP11_06430 [Acidimicrobiales bacterium]
MAGAAGGLAGGLATVGANLQSGFEAVSERVNLVDQIENADLVITGEGEVKNQFLREKLWERCSSYQSSCKPPFTFIAGSIDSNVRLPVPSYSLKEHVGLDKLSLHPENQLRKYQ